ncbi:MAG: GDP-mannose 4,6-dehydratase [Holosporaceae bacterium]|jgi:CDP-paratose 2-epimerase|nr:GDP-mannose 4,6-dehydratase [Holosporaceae bacterium]
MKLLITGGGGFLGANLAEEAIKRRHDVLIYDNLSRCMGGGNLELLKSVGDFKFVKADTANSNSVNAVIKDLRPDAVFHVAGQVAVTTSILDPELDFKTNAIGTFNVLNALRNYAPESYIVYSSTNKVYGDLNEFNYVEKDNRYVVDEFPDGFDETLPLNFQSPYGCSKGAADQYVLDFSRIYGVKSTVFRHSAMYGPKQFSTIDQGWIGWFCEMALETKKTSTHTFTICANGKQVRDVLYADDVVDLYFLALENREKLNGQAFNIGGKMENSLSLLELFSFLENELNVKLKYEKLPPRVSDQKIFVADIKKITEYIGWEPKVPKDLGIRNMLKYLEGRALC